MSINKNIRNYFFADIISQLGSNISLISLNWFLLERTGLNEQVGILMLLGIVGGLITAPFGGIIADHFNRKSVLIYSNFVRAICITTVVILLVSQDFSIYYLYILAIINGVGFNIYLPAAKAFVQEVVRRESIVKWNGLIEMSVQISMLIAGALTGLVYKIFGIKVILTIDALTFILGNFFLYRVKYYHSVTEGSNENFVQIFLKGFRYFLSSPIIFIFIFIFILSLPHVATIILNVVMPGYVLYWLHSDSLTYGVMSMSYGMGASMACLIFIYISAIKFSRSLIYTLLLVSITSLIVMCFNNSIAVAYLSTMFFGFANSGIKIILLSTIMKVVSKEYMGRVISVKNLLITTMQMIATYNIGFVMDKYGAVSGYIFLAVIMVCSLLGYIIFSKSFEPMLGWRYRS